MPMDLFGAPWEKDREEGQFYLFLNNGDCIGFDEYREEFSLNNYWNAIDSNVAESLLRRYGSEGA
jgi:hypothetical protein